MIRFIYWSLALIEVLLVLAVLLLFIITDSRAIKYIAKTSLDASGLRYESIEGNLFDGLSLKNLSHKKKKLFSSALIHWNPLSLLQNKITITQLDVNGIELDNIMAMINEIKLKKSEKQNALKFSIVVERTHLDINPYIYEGVKFSSFVFETGKIEIDKKLNVNTNRVYLKFDSDIVNVKMNANIKNSQLLVDNLELKNIYLKDIIKLIGKLKSKAKKEKHNKKVFLKEIKIKHILGSMKAVQYGDLKIEGARLHLYDALIEPSKSFRYQVKKLDFKGHTNFGRLNYQGYVKDANIKAKGEITLDKKLFKKYALPLNFKALQKLPSTLRLNHNAVWIDIDHNLKKLLNIKSDFNLDISKAKHKLHYDYSDAVFTVDSELKGSMTYAKAFKLKNKVTIDKKGFSYAGDINISQLDALPKVVSEYLLSDLKVSYKANSHDFEMDLESTLLTGHLSMPKYKVAKLFLKSKESNIELKQLVADLPKELQYENVSFDSTSFFDFKNLKKSKIEIDVQSNILDLNAKMKLEKPFEIFFISKINNETLLQRMLPKLKFSNLKYLEGTLKIQNNTYLINVKNQYLKLFMDYNSASSTIEETRLNIGKQLFDLKKDINGNLIFQSNISNIQGFFENIQAYYDFKTPNIQGKVDLQLEQHRNGTFWINFKSPKLQYLSEDTVDLAVLNIYNIDTTFNIDKDFNIEINSYQFNLDDNGYLNAFYSNKISSLYLEDNNLKIKNFWLNDNIEVTGDYNINSLKGALKLYANRYELTTKDFALVLGLDLSIKLDKEKIDIEGDIDILGDTITYEVMGTDIVEDADIIIVEDMVRKKESAFNNFKLYIKIKSKKPLRYIADNVNIEFFNELSLLKNYNQKMLLTGVTTITNGYYQLEEKEFLLDESHLYFTGDIKTPLLDIKANYEKDEYNIHVFISGTTDAPIVNFNSEPYLTQQEILSLILFDGTGSSSGKGAEAYTLLGGSFAKGLIKSLGIDVDHLLLGKDRDEQLSLEVGRKVSKDISILYLRRDGLNGVKVRMEHSKSFETDIIIQPPNTSSIEFLYKRDR